MELGFGTLAVQSLNLGVVVLDSHARIVSFNSWLERTSGLRASDVQGKRLSVVFPEWAKGHLARAVNTALSAGEPCTLGAPLEPSPFPLHWDEARREAGERLVQAIEVRPFAVAGAKYCTIQILDVTAAFERELRASELVERADHARRTQREFLARMTHEIRTPMNGVLALTELLLMSELDADQRETAEVIHHSSHALLAIINDVLDLSKIDAGKMIIAKAACDVRRVTREVRAVLQIQANEKAIELRVEVEPTLPDSLVIDELRCRQVLLNLLGNAVKFTPPQGRVTLRLSWSQVSTTLVTLCFSVADTGIGIEEPGRLFRNYTQADSTISKRFGGTGLGLSISKQLVELMGGTIGVESVPGRGSNFWFTLPSELDAGLAGEVAPTSATLAKHAGRVLVVDDNRVNRLVASKLLAQIGYHVSTADNGRIAVDMVAAAPFDIVFMDCQMPVLDGYEATRELRRLGFTELPIIAVTAGAVEGEREYCLESGMSDYLAKPLTLKAVSALLERLRVRAA